MAISARIQRSWCAERPLCPYDVILLTFPQLTDWLAHVPKDVLAKNFQADISAFDHIPGDELYIFPSCKSPVSPACFGLKLPGY